MIALFSLAAMVAAYILLITSKFVVMIVKVLCLVSYASGHSLHVRIHTQLSRLIMLLFPHILWAILYILSIALRDLMDPFSFGPRRILYVHYAGLYPARPSVLRLPSVGLQTPDSGLPAPSGLSRPTAPIGLIRLIGPIVLRDLTELIVPFSLGPPTNFQFVWVKKCNGMHFECRTR